MLRGLIRAALTAILIPIASTFALAQAPAAAAWRAMLSGTTHYTIFPSPARPSAVTAFLEATKSSRSR